MYHEYISASCVIVTFSGQSDTFTEVIVSVILVDIYYSGPGGQEIRVNISDKEINFSEYQIKFVRYTVGHANISICGVPNSIIGPRRLMHTINKGKSSRRHRHVARIPVSHLAAPRVLLFFFLPYFEVTFDRQPNRHTEIWIVFVKQSYYYKIQCQFIFVLRTLLIGETHFCFFQI